MAYKQQAIASFKKSAADWAGKSILACALAAAVFVYEPARDAVVDQWERGIRIEQQLEIQSDSIDTLQQDVGNVRADIDALRRPNDIFEVSTFLSNPAHGFCSTPGPCELKIWVRRVHGAQNCEIIPSRTQDFLVNRNSGISRSVERLNTDAHRNVGLYWTPLLVVLDILRTVPVGSSLYYVVTFYANCPGAAPGDDPIRDESRSIEIELRSN